MNENPAGPQVAAAAAALKPLAVTLEEKAEWVRRFNESGQSLRQFGARHGLGYMALWRWVSKSREAARAPTLATFTEIKLPAPVVCSNWAAELSLPNGLVLRVGHDLPVALLQQLLRVC
jgi:hypothetical protein